MSTAPHLRLAQDSAGILSLPLDSDNLDVLAETLRIDDIVDVRLDDRIDALLGDVEDTARNAIEEAQSEYLTPDDVSEYLTPDGVTDHLLANIESPCSKWERAIAGAVESALSYLGYPDPSEVFCIGGDFDEILKSALLGITERDHAFCISLADRLSRWSSLLDDLSKRIASLEACTPARSWTRPRPPTSLGGTP
jgi:hypothetical protein